MVCREGNSASFLATRVRRNVSREPISIQRDFPDVHQTFDQQILCPRCIISQKLSSDVSVLTGGTKEPRHGQPAGPGSCTLRKGREKNLLEPQRRSKKIGVRGLSTRCPCLMCVLLTGSQLVFHQRPIGVCNGRSVSIRTSNNNHPNRAPLAQW